MAGYYGGFMGNEAGMQGTIAGQPSFQIPGATPQYRFPYLPNEDPERVPIQLIPRQGQQLFPVPGAQRMLPQARGGTPPMGNAGFYDGPQYGQQAGIPGGFQRKIIS